MNKFLVAVSAAAMAVAAGAAHAATFTESVQFGAGPTDFHSATGTTAGPGGNQLYYFDSSVGTLNSITFSYSYALSSTISLTNTSASASNGNARTQSASQFGSNASAITNALNSVVNDYVDPVDGTSVSFGASTLSPIASDVRGNANSYNLASGASTTFASNGSYSRNGIVVTAANVLAAFSQAGGGSFTPLFSTLSGLVISNSGGNTTATQVTTAQGNLTISYDYTVTPPADVPEPAMLGLFGLGAIGLGLARRRKA